jgi:hypothetical protein
MGREEEDDVVSPISWVLRQSFADVLCESLTRRISTVSRITLLFPRLTSTNPG